MTSRLPEFDPDAPADVREGRRFPYGTFGEYVALADISDRAFRVYCLLRMHVRSGDEAERAWPTQPTLAEMLRLKKRDAIGDAIRELVSIGAVDVEVMRDPGRGRRNVYHVHEAPPPGFKGLVSRSQFYAARRAASPDRGIAPESGATPQTGHGPRFGGGPPGEGDGWPPNQGRDLPQVDPTPLPPASGGSGAEGAETPPAGCVHGPGCTRRACGMNPRAAAAEADVAARERERRERIAAQQAATDAPHPERGAAGLAAQAQIRQALATRSGRTAAQTAAAVPRAGRGDGPGRERAQAELDQARARLPDPYSALADG